MTKFLKKIKSQKGISGVIVALMLVLVGVVAVVGIRSFLNTQQSTVNAATTAQVTAITADANATH